MKTTPYLTFPGTCAEAFAFYAKVLNGKIDSMFAHRGTPAAEHVPADWLDKIMHAHLVFGGGDLMGSDNSPAWYKKAEGLWVSLHVDSAAEADRIFSALSEGGEIRMPIEKTFWAERFGMTVDRFGTPWMVNCPAAA
jgi:PhnB protein